MVTLAFNAHWSDFLSGTLLLSSGLRFRSNDHSMKHAYSLRPCSLSTARGPYLLGAREAPGGILGSLGSPRGYASAYTHTYKRTSGRLVRRAGTHHTTAHHSTREIINFDSPGRRRQSQILN